MTISLPCGRGQVALKVPECARGRVTILESRPAKPVADPTSALETALAEPIGSLPLAELARGRRSACVVVSDITRPAPNRVILPPLLRTLESAGLPRDAVTLLVATGMHRLTQGPELLELLGPDLVRDYRVVNHDCRDRAVLRQVDAIDGAPIELNREYVDADLKVLTGLIEPHAFAGFSGGGKSVLPGVASFETMAFMHSYALLEQPEVACATIEGNPFRNHVDRVCRVAGADFLVNVTVDKKRRITGLFAGHVREAFRAGCAAASAHQVLDVDRRADLVVTTGGGYPLDQTFYQATKGLVTAGDLVRPGGTMVLVAGCEEGLGGRDFCDVIRSSGSPEGFRKLHGDGTRFVVDQWTAQAFFRVLETVGSVCLCAPGLPAEEVRSFGLTPVADLDALVEEALRGDARAYVVPEGPYVAARPAGERAEGEHPAPA